MERDKGRRPKEWGVGEGGLMWGGWSLGGEGEGPCTERSVLMCL